MDGCLGIQRLAGDKADKFSVVQLEDVVPGRRVVVELLYVEASLAQKVLHRVHLNMVKAHLKRFDGISRVTAPGSRKRGPLARPSGTV